MVMMGDFNYHINWEEMEGERKEDRKFIDMVNDTFLQQHVEETTREGSKYTLDLILTMDETLVNKVKVKEIFNRSDHQIIRWTLFSTQKVQLFQGRLLPGQIKNEGKRSGEEDKRCQRERQLEFVEEKSE